MNIKFKTATDFRKSLEARLKSLALETGVDLQRLRRKVAFDRLLARIFSQEDTPFFLKGGYAMELRLSNARATKDIDLTYLERLKAEESSVSDLILENLRIIARKDLNDFFTYQVGAALANLDNAPYGGARYSVSSFIDSRLFVRFQMDVGGDAIVTRIETIQGADWLGYCGIAAPTIVMISIEQQFAEKLHAYTLPRLQGTNTRVKDLIDMVLLMKMRTVDINVLREALQRVFKIRGTHLLPKHLEEPPPQWRVPYTALAHECELKHSLSEAFVVVADVYKQVVV